MKKTILSTLLLGILFTNCENKQAGQNDTKKLQKLHSTVKSETEKVSRHDAATSANALEFLYKSDSGEMVTVFFFEKDDKKYAEVNRDKQAAIVLVQISAGANRSVYEKDNYRWTSQHGQATYTNGIDFLHLTLISPLKYTYTNGREDITITYFSRDGKKFVTIQKDTLPGITLEQTTARLKDAEYGKGALQWHSQSNRGTLIEDGIKTEFTEKE